MRCRAGWCALASMLACRFTRTLQYSSAGRGEGVPDAHAGAFEWRGIIPEQPRSAVNLGPTPPACSRWIPAHAMAGSSTVDA